MTVYTDSRRFSRPAALLAFALASSLSLAQYKGALPPPDDLKVGFEAVSVDDAKRHLAYLAGPECEGRGTGQPGFQKAAEYVAARFKEMGLVPIGDNGTYFQGVPFTIATVDAEGSSLVGPGINLRAGGFGVRRASEAATSSEAIVFLSARSGVSLPEGLDLAGKAVVVNAPVFDPALSQAIGQRNPAIVLVLVEKTNLPRPEVVRGNRGNRGARTVVCEIDRAAALSMAKASGVDQRILNTRSEEDTSVIHMEAAGKVALTLKVKTEEIKVPNVVGMLPGSDPLLKHQYIGVGSHLDHEGVRDGVVYPGADDDGSGSTALLLVAKAVTSNPLKPRRSVVFMAFCGEELGLIGSRYYTDHPIMPLADMSCLLQMDMVGRNEAFPNANPPEKAEDNVHTIHLIGSKRISTELHQITMDTNSHIGFEFEWDEEDVYTRSDHANFAQKGVPITFLFSGFHPDYHRPTDTIEKINYDKIVSTARLNYLVLQRVAALPGLVKRDVGG